MNYLITSIKKSRLEWYFLILVQNLVWLTNTFLIRSHVCINYFTNYYVIFLKKTYSIVIPTFRTAWYTLISYSYMLHYVILFFSYMCKLFPVNKYIYVLFKFKFKSDTTINILLSLYFYLWELDVDLIGMRTYKILRIILQYKIL